MKRNAHKSQRLHSHHNAVHFELAAPAREVCLAGSFNDWHPAAAPMIDLGGGRWAKDLALPPGGYEYLFVVDGEWRPDPRATDYAPNPFGGMNCVLHVAGNGTPAAAANLGGSCSSL